MDYVARPVDGAPRIAGINNPSGRSTDQSRDTWDGTVGNDHHSIAAPGVYYYEIRTAKGKKSFGKIIVAKN